MSGIAQRRRGARAPGRCNDRAAALHCRQEDNVPATLFVLFMSLTPQAPVPAPGTQDVVVVLEERYHEVHGKLVGIDYAFVRILVGKPSRELDVPIARVKVVATLERDGVLDGAFAGALVTSALCALNCGQGSSPSNPLSKLILRAAVQGAVIGALIDLVTRKRTVIFRR
jgi:hypothetical protein